MSQSTGTDLLRRNLPCEVRALDAEKREAEFVAATETPVRIDAFGTREVLRMQGVRLQRFRANPVVLDSHDRFDLSKVIGSATVKRQGRELVATIRYADTERGRNAWALVRDGHVRAVSVGYAINPERLRFVADGEADGEGESRVEGPAVIAREWTLLEISNVAIPADHNALRRSFYAEHFPSRLQNQESAMADSVYGKAVSDGQQGSPAAPDEGRQAPSEQRSEQTQPEGRIVKLAELDEERAARVEKARQDHIRTIAATFPGLEDVRDECLRGNVTPDQARARFFEEHAKRAAPVGTPEPAPVRRTAEPETTESNEEREADIGVAVRSLFGRA